MKAHCEIIVGNLTKIGLKKVNNNHWICKASADEEELQKDAGVWTSIAAGQFTGEDMGTRE